MLWALWSSVCRWNFLPFQLPWIKVAHLLFYLAWIKKKQLQYKAHIWVGKAVPSPNKLQRLQDVRSLFSIISHWIAHRKERHSFCAEMPVSNDTWDFYVVALQRMPKELEHEGENGHFSLIICLWHAWRAILSLQHFIRFLNFPLLRNPALSPALQLTETSWVRHILILTTAGLLLY